MGYVCWECDECGSLKLLTEKCKNQQNYVKNIPDLATEKESDAKNWLSAFSIG